MAKRKKCKACAMAAAARNKGRKRRSRRSKGIFGTGGVGNVPVQQIASMSVGALTAYKFADGLLAKVPVKMIQDDARVRNGIKAALGVVLSMQKNEMLANFGLGMAAVGAAQLVSAFLPGGAPAVQGIGRYQLGTGPMEYLAGLGKQSNYMAGTDYWDGVGTEPDFLAGDSNDGLAVV